MTICVYKASWNGLECLWACWKGQELSKNGCHHTVLWWMCCRTMILPNGNNSSFQDLSGIPQQLYRLIVIQGRKDLVSSLDQIFCM